MDPNSIVDTALDRSLIGYGNVGYLARRRFWPADPPADALAGKVALVTGAKTGLGRATAAGLARLGARVHMIVRGRTEGERVRDGIRAENPDADLVVDECDVSSMSSVRRYASGFTGPLHVLIHNAGVMPDQRETTEEGNELTFATHVLGPHLLTTLLRPALAADPPARVIWVSSGGMYAQRLPAGDLQMEATAYRSTTAYARTKRMQVVLAEEWADRLRDDGIVVHSAHPGWVDTPGVSRWLPKFKAVTRPLLRTPEQGADTLVWLAASTVPLESSGGFWHDRRLRPTHYLSRTREDSSERRMLWERCETLSSPAGRTTG